MPQQTSNSKQKICPPKNRFAAYHALFSFTLKLSAQKLSGKITDQKNNPLELATLQLFAAKDTTKPLQITLSDSLGNFELHNLRKGNYLLKASYLHYPKVQLNFSLKKDTALNIAINAAAQELQNVTVKATRPLLKKEGNKLVLNIEAIAIFKGKSAL